MFFQLPGLQIRNNHFRSIDVTEGNIAPSLKSTNLRVFH